ncbi:MAG TPA: hypothetical protein VGV64_05670, partial [Thermoplasmata archaeon]|nr:hypothetical protein [Thermoplasmata archaeon]
MTPLVAPSSAAAPHAQTLPASSHSMATASEKAQTLSLPSVDGRIAPTLTVRLGSLFLGGPHGSGLSFAGPKDSRWGVGSTRIGVDGRTPAASSLAPQPQGFPYHIAVSNSTEGLGFSNSGGATPPDVQIASGPGYELEFVNLEGAVFRSNGAVVGSYFLGTFFGTGSDSLSDPKILYDNLSSRWFASIIHINSARTSADNRLAVSNTSDPTGNWTFYTLSDPPGLLGDQPILGVSSTLVSVSVNIFSSTNVSSEFWVINKSSILHGGPMVERSYGPNIWEYSDHPVQSVSANPSLFLVETNQTTGGVLELLNITGVPPATVTIKRTNLTLSTYSQFPYAAQPGSSDVVDLGDARVQTAVWERGLLWLAFTTGCIPVGDTSARSCIRLVEVNTTAVSVTQEFDYGIKGVDVFYPALALDGARDVTMIYGESSTSIYPSLYATGRLAGDPVGSLFTPTLVAKGLSNFPSCGGACRYGDYFGAGQVPNSSRAWIAGEYLGGVDYWQTRLAETSISTAPLPSTVQLAVSSRVVDVGQSTTVTFTMLNSSCVASSGFCRVHLPLTRNSVDLACTGNFTATQVVDAFTAPGNFSEGSGGYVAVYNSSSCTGTPALNLTAVPVVVTVHLDPTLAVAAAPAFPIELGETVTLKLTASAGTSPYAFRWSSLPLGCVGLNAPQVACLPTATGSGRMTATVTDGVGVNATVSLSYQVVVNPSVTLSANSVAIDIGQTIEFTSSVSGGLGALSYVWVGLPTGCVSQNTAQFFCLPTGPGSGNISLTVTDAHGFSSSSSVFLTVYPSESVVIDASSIRLTAGGVLNLSALVTGGHGPFDYAWSGLPASCLGSNGSQVVCTPKTAGVLHLTASVTDALGESATGYQNVTVLPAPSSPATGSGTLSQTELLTLGILVVVAAG